MCQVWCARYGNYTSFSVCTGENFWHNIIVYESLLSPVVSNAINTNSMFSCQLTVPKNIVPNSSFFIGEKSGVLIV